MTWLTASAMTPIIVFWFSICHSTMMMQVVLLTGRCAKPNLTARSTTGTTFPRRLMTPRIHEGVFGTEVTVSYPIISFTRKMLIAYSSSARRKVRYCCCSATSLIAAAIILSPLKSRPVPFREIVIALAMIGSHMPLGLRRPGLPVRLPGTETCRSGIYLAGAVRGGLGCIIRAEEGHQLHQAFRLRR